MQRVIFMDISEIESKGSQRNSEGATLSQQNDEQTQSITSGDSFEIKRSSKIAISLFGIILSAVFGVSWMIGMSVMKNRWEILVNYPEKPPLRLQIVSFLITSFIVFFALVCCFIPPWLCKRYIRYGRSDMFRGLSSKFLESQALLKLALLFIVPSIVCPVVMAISFWLHFQGPKHMPYRIAESFSVIIPTSFFFSIATCCYVLFTKSRREGSNIGRKLWRHILLANSWSPIGILIIHQIQKKVEPIPTR